MRIGFVTDEISPDFEEAIRVGTSWGIRDYELRMIGANRIPGITPAQVERIAALKEQHQLNITALSPGTFKGTLQDHEQLEREVTETLPKTFEIAAKLGAKMVIVFGVQRSPQDPAEGETTVIDLFKRVAAAAQQRGLMIAIENEPGFWCDSGANTARIIEKVDSPALRANWDPANAVGTEEIPFPDGYRALKKWIANVHIKDTVKGALLECVPVGEGKVDWPGQLRALKQDKLVEHVVIETHCLPLIEKSQHNLKVVREMLSSG